MLLLRVKVTSFMSFARQKAIQLWHFQLANVFGKLSEYLSMSGGLHTHALQVYPEEMYARCRIEAAATSGSKHDPLVPPWCRPPGATCLTPTCLTPLPDGVAQWQIQDATWSHGIRPRSIYIMRSSVPWLSLALSAEIFIFLIFRLSC